MRAYRLEQFKTIDDLVLRDEETPKPGRREVLVRVRASSLNYRDLAILHGSYPMSCATGHIPLSDGAGEVVEVGEGVKRFEAGSRVVNTFFPRWFGGRFQSSSISEQYGSEQYGSDSDGWLTEYKVVSEESLVAIPPHLSFEEAATLPCAAVTAWSALTGPRPIIAGDTVLTQGSGGVSLFAVQLAKLLGARVIATTSSSEKMAKLKSLGADDVIDYTAMPDWDKEVRRLTNGQGVDRVIEVGGPGTLLNSIKSCAIGGEVALIGFLANAREPVDFMSLFMGGVTLRRIAVGSRDDFENMNRAIEQHKLHPVIDSVFPFMDAKEAWRHFDDRKHFGKVVIAH